MTFIAKGLTALVLMSTLGVSSIAPVQAQSLTFSFGQRDRVITSYCDRHPNDRDCRSYYGGGWHESDYDRFYHRRRSALDNIASGLFGFGFGAILGAAIANSHNNGRVEGNYSAHVDACYDRFRSYDEETDSYLGYDGFRHRCNL